MKVLLSFKSQCLTLFDIYVYENFPSNMQLKKTLTIADWLIDDYLIDWWWELFSYISNFELHKNLVFVQVRQKIHFDIFPHYPSSYFPLSHTLHHFATSSKQYPEVTILETFSRSISRIIKLNIAQIAQHNLVKDLEKSGSCNVILSCKY